MRLGWETRVRATMAGMVLLFCGALEASAELLPHSGDFNGSGTLNITDVNCGVEAVLTGLQGLSDPACQVGSDTDVDVQCDGSLDITDVQRTMLVVLLTLSGDTGLEELVAAKDPDLDLVHSGCDLDDDNDTFPDVCEIEYDTDTLDPEAFPAVPNACTCPNACDIGGACVEPGTVNPEDDCFYCDVEFDPSDWTSTGAGGCPALGGCVLPPNAVCGLSGDSGETVECAVNSAWLAVASDATTAIEFKLSWDTTDLEFVSLGIFGSPAPGAPEIFQEVPPAALSNGHSVTLNGTNDQIALNGDLTLLAANISDPSAALNDALYVDGTIVGDPSFLLARFELAKSAGASAGSCPVYVFASEILGASSVADPAVGDVVDGIIITAPWGTEIQPCSAKSLPDLYCQLTDNNVCNGLETCDLELGKCAPGTPLDCADDDACTDDLCHPGDGCMQMPTDCDDGLACTIDACNPAAGCTHTPNDAQCDDEEPCNGMETCSVTVGCQAAAEPPCDDGIACTVNECDLESGDCTFVEDDAACDDSNSCTIDVCSSAEGCQHVATPAEPCEDGTVCTTDETCSDDGVCTGLSVPCDDEIPCTTDSCDPVLGCQFTPSTAACGGGQCAPDDFAADPITGCVSYAPELCESDADCSGPLYSACDPEASNSAANGCAPDFADDFCTEADPALSLGEDGFPICAIYEMVDENGPFGVFSPQPGPWATCPIRLAAHNPECTPGNCRASAMQFIVRFDKDKIEMGNFYDLVNVPGFGTFNVNLSGIEGQPGSPMSTGHTVSTTPSSSYDWNAQGWGAVVVVNLASPSAALSNASVVDAGTAVDDDPVVMDIWFRAAGPTTTFDEPARVCLAEALCTNGSSLPLSLGYDSTLGTLVTCPPGSPSCP